MAQIRVNVAGNSYTLACADGEQDHLTRLVAAVDQRASDLKAKLGHVNEAKLMLMAAVLLADELEESTGAGSVTDPATTASVPEESAATILDGVTREIEQIANHMRSA